jgi:hypothetical protein
MERSRLWLQSEERKMEEKTLECWEQFEETSLKAISDTRKLKEERGGQVDYPLFRGVGDSEYHLESSLERVRKATSLCAYTSLSQYCHTLNIVRDHIETITGKKWNLDTKVLLGEFEFPAYEFMVYLRQNGFPSPLLDWTRSPYIAAFFAFRDIYRVATDKEYVSVFVYREQCGNGKGWCEQEPHVRGLGPTIATCPTHYLQQSEYSICVQKKKDGQIYFANHEEVKSEEGEDEQDVLIRYNIPMSEREKVLRRLDSMNITAYSLFGSEPSLMDTLAIRELVLEI